MMLTGFILGVLAASAVVVIAVLILLARWLTGGGPIR